MTLWVVLKRYVFNFQIWKWTCTFYTIRKIIFLKGVSILGTEGKCLLCQSCRCNRPGRWNLILLPKHRELELKLLCSPIPPPAPMAPAPALCITSVWFYLFPLLKKKWRPEVTWSSKAGRLYVGRPRKGKTLGALLMSPLDRQLLLSLTWSPLP